MFIYKYLTVFFNTYPGLFGWIDYQEECWKYQRLVEIIKYLAASLDYFRTSHCFWRESGGILCAFIPEGRMFPTLKRLNSTTNKGRDYMISSNSFVFEFGNGAKNTFDLFATGHVLDQLAWTWGAPATLSGSGDSKFPTWNQKLFHSVPLPAGS